MAAPAPYAAPAAAVAAETAWSDDEEEEEPIEVPIDPVVLADQLRSSACLAMSFETFDFLLNLGF